MALDNFDRLLGRFAQRHPAEWGRIKQLEKNSYEQLQLSSKDWILLLISTNKLMYTFRNLFFFIAESMPMEVRSLYGMDKISYEDYVYSLVKQPINQITVTKGNQQISVTVNQTEHAQASKQQGQQTPSTSQQTPSELQEISNKLPIASKLGKERGLGNSREALGEVEGLPRVLIVHKKVKTKTFKNHKRLTIKSKVLNHRDKKPKSKVKHIKILKKSSIKCKSRHLENEHKTKRK